MSSSKRLDTVRDSIASLFKRRTRRGVVRSGGGSDSDDSRNGGQKISTPQNVKRVMHITFNSGSQGFDGIPEHWRQYFESPSQAATTAAQVEAVPQLPSGTMSVIHEEPARDVELVSYVTEPANGDPESQAEPETTEPAELRRETQVTQEVKNEVVPPQSPRRPRELLSLVYDRDAGQFVNLPQHWTERLERNNLLAPEFHSNPHLLPLVFSLMDQELRTMRAEGARVESSLYSSPSLREQSRLTVSESIPDSASERTTMPPYVFRIEADKSNSSSELDLLNEYVIEEEVPQKQSVCEVRRSLVTVRAVEVPRAIEDDMTQL